MSDCNTCESVLRRFTDPESLREKINFGSFDDALASPCQNHTPLIKAFRDHDEQYRNKHPEMSPKNSSVDVGLGLRGTHDSVPMYESVSELGLTWSLLLANKPDVPNHKGVGRIMDLDWIDLDTVNKWKHECVSSHGSKCTNPLRISQRTPAWLVDTHDMRVVPGEGHIQYVALSYRWGEAPAFRLDSDTLDKVLVPNSLDRPEIFDRLPLMIQHALALTPRIGERYLWVDALCIVHGGGAATAEQVDLMGAIYANAVFTIIAADGTASDGLPGLKDISAPRELEQKIISFGDEQILVRNTGIFGLEHGTDYFKRAWTYQELKMSRRKLLFTKKEVHWQCQCSVWHEDLTLWTELDKYIDPRLSHATTGFSDLSSLSHMVGDYNERALTYDDDALSGIAGLLTVCSRSFTGGFLYGLPEMLFDRALTWRPMWNHINLRRRTPSDRKLEDRVLPAGLPSWSWIGWEGLVTFSGGEASRMVENSYRTEETIPITGWFTSGDSRGLSLRKIKSTWFENRDTYKAWARDTERALPDGWIRHEDEKDESDEGNFRLYPDGCGGRFFKHKNMTDDDSSVWPFPFPVADISEQTPFVIPEQTQYLFCKTKQGRIWTERADNEPFPGGHNNLKVRVEQHGDVVGRLHLHDEEQLQLWPKAGKEADEISGRRIDVVAISAAVIKTKTFREDLKKYTGPIKREERYNVLWVEWKDGVAYRLASGHVEKSAWDGLELVDVDLVLG